MLRVKEFKSGSKSYVVTDSGEFYYYTKRTGLLEKGRLCDNGKGYLSAGINGKRKYIHRLVAESFCNKPCDLHVQVNHIDGDKSNNSYRNLEWVTPKNNIKHAHLGGLMENRRKLTTTVKRSDKVVASSYLDVKLGKGITKTATKHEMSRTTLSSIVNKRTRRNLTDKIDEILMTV